MSNKTKEKNTNTQKTYEEVFKNSFNNDFQKLDELYNYCRSNKFPNSKSESKRGYHKIVEELVKTDKCDLNEGELALMQKINYIALWKTNRIIEFYNAGNIIEGLEEIKKEEQFSNKAVELMRELLNDKNKGIDLPMASTILHFYYPNKYPIIDRRAHRALGALIPSKSLKIIKDKNDRISNKINIYYDYVKRCEEFLRDPKELGEKECKNKDHIKLNNIDKFLYQIDKETDQPLDKYKIK